MSQTFISVEWEDAGDVDAAVDVTSEGGDEAPVDA